MAKRQAHPSDALAEARPKGGYSASNNNNKTLLFYYKPCYVQKTDQIHPQNLAPQIKAII